MQENIHLAAPKRTSKHRHDISWEQDCYPYSNDFGDHFYSRTDGRAECQHVFIEGNRLIERWRHSDGFTIGELGFGTGLNFIETWNLWRKVRRPGQRLDFVSFEIAPLDCEQIEKATSHWPDLRPLVKTLIDHWQNREQHNEQELQPWALDEQTSLQVVFSDALSGLDQWDAKADAWYLDGFSPSKNPSMWSLELMKEVFLHTAKNGTFATYTSAGWVRRNLQSAGFDVERVPGHGNKRHMSIGSRTSVLCNDSIKQR